MATMINNHHLFLLSSSLLLLSVWSPLAARSQSSSSSSSSSPPPGQECLNKVIPCAAFIRPSAPRPPPTCCDPLEQALDTQLACLCTLFYNNQLLKQFNVTRDQVRAFPKKCGAPEADEALCKKAGVEPPPSSSTPVTPASPVPATPTPPTPSAAGKTSGSNSLGQSIISVAAILVAGAVLCLNVF